MARIASETRQQILDRTDFLSVYQEHVRLTRKGSSYWGLCPFHAEKTPSFSVSAETGLFYCFGCHKGGSVIQFLMDLDKLSYTEAMEELARRAGVELHFEQSEAARETDRERQALLELYDRLSRTFNWFLCEHASGTSALAILRKRGIPDTLVERFRLGYAPSQRNWLYSFLKSKGYSDEFLARSGLFSRNDPSWPLFSGRIMFPITDVKGRVIAFGGRTMQDEGPKYINSPDTLLFRKQEHLFGIAQALESIKAKDEAIICEGYMDVLSFHAAGIANAVAPLGTAFTSQQALALKRRASRAILCFDADEAGMKAAERACAIATAAGLETSVLILKGGKDASEILESQGAEELTRLSKNTINSGHFLLDRASRIFDITTMDGKAKAVSFLFPFMDALDSDVKRQEFIKETAKVLGVSAHAVEMDYARARASDTFRIRRDAVAQREAAAEPLQRSRAARTLDLLFMTAVILSDASRETIVSKLTEEDLEDQRARDLLSALKEAEHDGVRDIDAVLSMCADEAAVRFVREIAASGEIDGAGDKIIEDGLARIRKRVLEKECARLISQLQSLPRETDGADKKQLMEQIMRVVEELKKTGGSLDE